MAEDTKPKKVQIAIRDWLDSDGNPLSSGDESKVTGIRYIHLPSALRANDKFNPQSDPPPAGAFFDYMFVNPTSVNMLAAFGAQTLAGNVVNTVTNGPKGDKSMNPIPLIAERFADIDGGIWADREGGVGVRYDKDKLILAVLAAKKLEDNDANRAPLVAKLETKVDGKTGALAASDAKGAISWGAFALRNTVVKSEYDKLTGGGVSLDAI